MSRSNRASRARLLLLAGASAVALITGTATVTLGADGMPPPTQPTASFAPPLPSAPADVPDACVPEGASAAPAPSLSAQPAASPATVISLDASASPADAPATKADTESSSPAGDVPDNAIFLTYRDTAHGFSIDYVEGWQVTPGPDGVVIRDKDSSESVRIAPLPGDIAACVAGSELAAIQSQDGFSLIAQDLVEVNGQTLIHLAYHLPAPPDPVTGKRVPSTVDRYYVPGSDVMAVVSLSTPDGVDNVDAFRQMIRSLAWS
jgi:hypothetical protein